MGSDNPLGTDTLIPNGCLRFAWPVATKAWIAAISVSYKYETTQLPWLDYVLPYVEYSSIVKDEADFNDSQMATSAPPGQRAAGTSIATWSAPTATTSSAIKVDDYANIYNGVGDFGVDGNDEWNYPVQYQLRLLLLIR